MLRISAVIAVLGTCALVRTAAAGPQEDLDQQTAAIRARVEQAIVRPAEARRAEFEKLPDALRGFDAALGQLGTQTNLRQLRLQSPLAGAQRDVQTYLKTIRDEYAALSEALERAQRASRRQGNETRADIIGALTFNLGQEILPNVLSPVYAGNRRNAQVLRDDLQRLATFGEWVNYLDERRKSLEPIIDDVELTRTLLGETDAAYREILGRHGLGPDGNYRGIVTLTGGTVTFTTEAGRQSMRIPGRDVATIYLTITGNRLSGRVLAGDAEAQSRADISGSFDPASGRLAPRLGKFELVGDYDHPLIPLETLGGQFRLTGEVTEPGRALGGEWRLQLPLGGFNVDAQGTWTATK